MLLKPLQDHRVPFIEPLTHSRFAQICARRHPPMHHLWKDDYLVRHFQRLFEVLERFLWLIFGAQCQIWDRKLGRDITIWEARVQRSADREWRLLATRKRDNLRSFVSLKIASGQ